MVSVRTVLRGRLVPLNNMIQGVFYAHTHLENIMQLPKHAAAPALIMTWATNFVIYSKQMMYRLLRDFLMFRYKLKYLKLYQYMELMRWSDRSDILYQQNLRFCNWAMHLSNNKCNTINQFECYRYFRDLILLFMPPYLLDMFRQR